jgi:hypothetical protein
MRKEGVKGAKKIGLDLDVELLGFRYHRKVPCSPSKMPGFTAFASLRDIQLTDFASVTD